MDELIVDRRGFSVVDRSVPAAVGTHLPRGRMVCALPLPGVWVHRAVVVSLSRAVGALGGASEVVASPGVYVHRMVVAVKD